MNPHTLQYLMTLDSTSQPRQSARRRTVHLNDFRSSSRSKPTKNSHGSR